ncbi:4Fe-4S binding protein [Oceanirhabdus seepicola]|uniref:4Fe-4S binding protein n=1 Tax=Oceanirhabdus seepicola TaxID=2828781 RepID=A0A9J6P2P0_9CLOT|nr:4Fe-4S binding protein [Oceanirhabdus seepicola]MCM1989792.1 4Fe-4S binding protein [Oceanirhabdus seepicola]
MKRKFIQFFNTILINGYFKGFLSGKIYQGKLKKICVPGLNCYSCPGALGSCPIGSLQAVLGSYKYKISMYVTGFLIFFGALMGRFVCGWLCPFGLLQELLYKIKSVKTRLPKWTTYIKYVVLLVFVIILPLMWTNDFGMGDPTFCKYICPAGTLEGGIPLLILNKGLRSAAGVLFTWKISILILIIIASIFIFRPFCKVLCPLGAIYALFNPISLYRYSVDDNKCTKCGKCSTVCKMDVDIYKTPNSTECIRCGECVEECPTSAIKKGILSDK